MIQQTPLPLYEYSTFDSKKVQDIGSVCNEKAADGWELVQAMAAKDRYLSIFRRPKEPPRPLGS